LKTHGTAPNGLKISLAKKAEAKPKQIKVNVSGEKTREPEAVAKAA